MKKRNQRIIRLALANGPNGKPVKVIFGTYRGTVHVTVREYRSRRPLVLTEHEFIDRLFKIYRQPDLPGAIPK